MRFIAICLCLASAGLTGCVRAPIPITPVVHTEPEPDHQPLLNTRTDLPLNWTEVAQQDWSYGVPAGFNRVSLNVLPATLVQHYSALQRLTISFTTTNTSSVDLHEYVLDNFVLPQVNKVIAIKENNKAARPIVAIQTMMSPTTSALDFFVQKDKTIYHMSCFGDNSALQVNAATCFKVIDTLLIK